MVANHPYLFLDDRRILFVTGEDATHFLERLITTDVEQIGQGELFPGALLSPQGKVLFDFLIGRVAHGYLIDISNELAENFKKRLTLYKLRSKVEIAESLEQLISVSWGKDSPFSETDSTFADKRFPDKEKVLRNYNKILPPAPHSNELKDQWNMLRLQHGIAESGKDFVPGDVFPHDINYDQIGAISYKKGCYIGQEIVSRMHHRGTARRRMLVATSDDMLPPAGSIEADGKTIGTLGTVVAHKASAIVRIDRVKLALDQHAAFSVCGRLLTLTIAPNMGYSFPENTTEGE
ncbi:folate-binding protein YgfZ [uncultured Bartonella sp.]|uniref:CAF17-like 4Fe-4S cluster assembly/insertion protein YgfZ n=1 Tax=uncultured Bartonella sp. TaxID=104108 RepID=UPI00262F8294|nr:folate-binding protein YgfZ [uncultured Bartonella sp.]